jgi:hypothetical protein
MYLIRNLDQLHLFLLIISFYILEQIRDFKGIQLIHILLMIHSILVVYIKSQPSMP